MTPVEAAAVAYGHAREHQLVMRRHMHSLRCETPHRDENYHRMLTCRHVPWRERGPCGPCARWDDAHAAWLSAYRAEKEALRVLQRRLGGALPRGVPRPKKVDRGIRIREAS